MLWFDYRKTYDSIPHSWILECLRLLKAHQSLCHFLQQAMIHWKTELTFANTHPGTIDINCGIFLHDSFSLLLFIVSFIPLSLLLRRSNLGYKLSSGYAINHLATIRYRSDATSHSPHAGTCVLCTREFACTRMIRTRESPYKYSPRILPITRTHASGTVIYSHTHAML